MSSITIAEAAGYTANWRAFNGANQVNGIPLDQIFPNAYSVNMADITAITSNTQVAKIRIYFGYTSKSPEPQPTGTYPMRIMLVGVNAQGQDIIHGGLPVSGIYDHCQPCPSYCDTVSPLSQPASAE